MNNEIKHAPIKQRNVCKGQKRGRHQLIMKYCCFLLTSMKILYLFCIIHHIHHIILLCFLSFQHKRKNPIWLHCIPQSVIYDLGPDQGAQMWQQHSLSLLKPEPLRVRGYLYITEWEEWEVKLMDVSEKKTFSSS